MQDFRNLEVWQKAHRLALGVYAGTAYFPKGEMFGLTSQMRRVAVSVCANIAEGSARIGDKEFARFLTFATGSTSELEALCLLSSDLSYLVERTAGTLVRDVVEVRRMLLGLLAALDIDQK